jgi:hypothetical protein
VKTPMKILAVYREKIFSNRAVEADRAILDEVLTIFRIKMGHQCNITVVQPEEFSVLDINTNYDLVFSMAQDEKILTLLDILESKGAVVLNSSQSIRNCHRQKLSELLCDDAFAYPRFLTVDVENINPVLLDEKAVWIKRGDFHALVDDDVLFAGSRAEKITALENFKNRAVKKVLFQDHCEGELFKFYGVRDSYFNLRYMGRTGKDRYEFIPGDINVEFDKTRLELLAHRAARVLDLDFFGGDCIIDDQGKMHFIDLNDWPSFRTCVQSVAPVMVNYALKKQSLKNSESKSFGGLSVGSIIQ